MPTQKVKVIRDIPGRHTIGETVEMSTGEARLQIMAGKVIPAGGDAGKKLENKMITEGEVETRADRKRK